MKKATTIFFLLLLMGLAGSAQTVDPDFLDGEIYLKLEDTSSVQLEPFPGTNPILNGIYTLFGVDTLYKPFKNPSLDKIFRLKFTNINQVGSLVSQLGALGFIEYAEQIPLHVPTGTAAYTPNDFNPAQWYLTKIDASQAWDLTRGDSTLVIAVVDNAVSTTHEDLVGNVWQNPGEVPNFFDDDLDGFIDNVNGYDVADLDPDPNPPSGTSNSDPFVHGTHCAGLASAQADNGIGIASLGFNIQIMGVKASRNSLGGNVITNAYEGIDYSTMAGADIISMSFGSYGTSITGDRVIQTAKSSGVVLIGAAGNNDKEDMFYPAAYPQVLAVGATNSMDEKSGFSNYGSWVDVMAPGSLILSTLVEGDSSYGNQSGTSMAAPLVAGLAGLVLSYSPGMSVDDVYASIKKGCENIDAMNPDYLGKIGAGRINAHLALLATSREEARVPGPDFMVFPNPASGEVFMVRGEQLDAPGTVRLLSMDGRMLREKALPIGQRQLTLQVDAVPAGLYLVEFEQGGRKAFRKLVVN